MWIKAEDFWWSSELPICSKCIQNLNISKYMGERRLMWNQMGHAVSLFCLHTIHIWFPSTKILQVYRHRGMVLSLTVLPSYLLTYLPSVTQEKIALRKGRAWSGAPECWAKISPDSQLEPTYPEGMPHIVRTLYDRQLSITPSTCYLIGHRPASNIVMAHNVCLLIHC